MVPLGLCLVLLLVCPLEAATVFQVSVIGEGGRTDEAITSGMVEGVTSLISKDGEQIMDLTVDRGWNIVVFNRATGDIIDSIIFDTWYVHKTDEDPVGSMTDYLRAIPEDSVVAMGTWKTANKCEDECFEELLKLGSTLTKAVKYADSYALIGYKSGNGCESTPDWVVDAFERNPGSSNAVNWTEPVYAQADIPDNCGSAESDPCANEPCFQGSCSGTVDGGFECSCVEGYTGALCDEVEIVPNTEEETEEDVIRLDMVSEAGWKKNTITSGKEAGSTSLFKVNGAEFMSLPVARGWNIVVVDRATKTLVDKAVFDTWAQDRVENDPVAEMTTFLQSVPENSVVAMAVWDTGNNCVDECFNELKKLGSSLSSPLKYGVSYSMVGYKAGKDCDPHPEWVTDVLATNPGSGNANHWTEPVYLDVTIPKQCQITVVTTCADTPCDQGSCIDLDEGGYECQCNSGFIGSLCNVLNLDTAKNGLDINI